MTTFETIAKAFRYNSGRNLFDSGDYYGRHYEKPPIDEKAPMVTIDIWRNEVNTRIESALFLAEACEVDSDLQEQFEEWAALEENSDLSWFEAGEKFATEVLGLTPKARDNTYNGENDLSQDYVWEVYSDNDNRDWIYDDDALLVIYAHTGCDVRSGYSHPVFLRSKGDYACPVDLVAEWFISEGRLNGEKMDEMVCHEMGYQYQCGYTSNPSYQLSKDIERVFGFTKTADSVVVKLKSGEIIKIHASARTY